MQFNRFDILAAYYVFGCLYHGGQGSKEYGYICRAVQCGFEPGFSFTYESLSDNGKAIYNNLASSRLQ